mmetsp:Transcript_21157/g.51781  ORF Transcript_21157/g.51781 Transcript_21157/m.51781 type:complete len:214 (+) Transcript_21157:567-1208(+)
MYRLHPDTWPLLQRSPLDTAFPLQSIWHSACRATLYPRLAARSNRKAGSVSGTRWKGIHTWHRPRRFRNPASDSQSDGESWSLVARRWSTFLACATSPATVSSLQPRWGICSGMKESDPPGSHTEPWWSELPRRSIQLPYHSFRPPGQPGWVLRLVRCPQTEETWRRSSRIAYSSGHSGVGLFRRAHRSLGLLALASAAFSDGPSETFARSPA